MSPPPAGIYALEHEAYDEDAPRVVLVHGAMDRSAAFGRVVQRLSDLNVTVYDRRGYGRSAQAMPVATSLADHADDLEAILGGRPAVLVGHSYGGAVSLLVAARSPALVQAVGVFEAPAPWTDWWPQDADASPALAALAGGDPAAAAEAFIRRQLGDAAWEELPPQTQESRRAEGQIMLHDVASLRGEAPFDFADVAAPVVVGSGSASPDYHREGARRMADLLGAELIEVPDGGHASHSSHPAEFAAFARAAVALAKP